MSKLLKWLVASALSVVALAAVLVGLAVWLIDPDDHREQIARVLATHSGREISLDGPLSLSVWPAITVSAERVRVANPPGFGAGDLALAERIGFELAIRPLLQRQLAVDAVVIDGLRVSLVRNPAGIGNWETATAAAPTTVPAAPARDPGATRPDAAPRPGTQDGSGVAGAPTLSLDRVAGISVRNAQLTYADAPTGATHRFRGVGVEVGEIRAGEPITLRLVGEGRVDQGSGLQLTMDLTADIDPLAERLRVDNIRLGVDDSLLTGSLALSDFTNPHYTFDLRVDSLGLDRYLPNDAPVSAVLGGGGSEAVAQVTTDTGRSPARAAADGTANATARGTPTEGGSAVADGQQALEAIAALLEALRAEGRLRIERLHVRGVDLHDLDMTIRAEPGLVLLQPFQTRVAGGQVEAALRLEQAEGELQATLDATASRLGLDRIAGMLGVTEPVSGQGSLTASLTGHGSGPRGLERTLAGVITMAVSELDLPERGLRADLNGELTLPGGLEAFGLRIGQSSVRVQGPEAPGVLLDLVAETSIDRVGDRARIDAFALSGAGLDLHASGELRGLSAEPVFSGRLRASHAQLPVLLAALGQPIGLSAEAPVLRTLDMESGLRASREGIEFEELRLTLDQSTLRGALRLQDPNAPTLHFDLSIDTLDLDSYLDALGGEGEPQGAITTPAAIEERASRPWTGPLATAQATASRASAAVDDGSTALIRLRAAHIDGSLAIERLTVGALPLERVRATVSGEEGVIRAQPVTASVHGGQYQGALSVDLNHGEPVWTFDERLAGVNSGPLMRVLFGRNIIVGVGNAQLSGSARGQTAAALLASAEANVRADIRDGAILGMNIAQLIREAEARVRGVRGEAVAGPRQTDFATLVADLSLENGVATVIALNGVSPLLSVDGRGSIDLTGERIDLALQVQLLQRLERLDGRQMVDLRDVSIPLRIEGPLSGPVVRLDLEQLLRDQFEQQLRDEARELERELRERALEELQRRLRR